MSDQNKTPAANQTPSANQTMNAVGAASSMVNPPNADTTTKMVQPKLVKVKALKDFDFRTVKREDGPFGKAGETYMLEEKDAEELCRVITGQYNFGGEVISESATRHTQTRGQRVS